MVQSVKRIFLVAAGILISLALLEIILSTLGFILTLKSDYINRQHLAESDIRILCIGESTTAEASSEWSEMLEDILRQKVPAHSIKVINKGVAGTNSSVILSALPGYLKKYRPTIVLSMMGVNDAVIAEADSKHVLRKKHEAHSLYLIRLLLKHIASHMEESEDIEKNAIPDNKDPLVQAEACYRNGNIEEAFKMLDSVSDKEPENWQVYWMKAEFARTADAGIYEESYVTDNFKKAIEYAPDNKDLYIRYICWLVPGTPSKAMDIFKDVIKRIPLDYYDLIILCGSFLRSGNPGKAREVMDLAASFSVRDPVMFMVNNMLYSYLFKGQKDLTDALDNIMAEAPKPEDMKVMLYRFAGDLSSVDLLNRLNDYFAKHFTGLKDSSEYNELAQQNITFFNYGRIKDMLEKKGIPLLVMQYPMRSIKPLEDFFSDYKSVYFIDNEKVFRKAVAANGNEKYFKDLFAGDFGHTTPEGDKLIAENAAAALIGI